MSRKLESVLRKMVAPKVEDRYSSAADVLRELSGILDSLPPAAQRRAAGTGAGEKASSRDRERRRQPAGSRRKLMAIACVVILVFIVAGLFLLRGRSGKDVSAPDSMEGPTSQGAASPGPRASSAKVAASKAPLPDPEQVPVSAARKVAGAQQIPSQPKAGEEERGGRKAAPAVAPPAPDAGDAAAADLEVEVELSILQGDFARASKLAGGSAARKPELAAKLLRRVQMAESLHEARKEALSLQRAGKSAQARKVLLEVIPKLEGPLREEARLAAESLGPAED